MSPNPTPLPTMPPEIRAAIVKIDKIIEEEIEPHMTDELRHYEVWHLLSAYARLLDGLFTLQRLADGHGRAGRP